MGRPITQRELQTNRNSEDQGFVTILNISKQMIPVQLKPPTGVDFFVGEQTISLMPGSHAKFPNRRLYHDQVGNHQKAGRLRILSISTQ